MKREHLGWIVACLLIVVVAAGAMQQQAGIGRFSMVTFSHRDVVQTVLLDTATGEVRCLGSGKDRPLLSPVVDAVDDWGQIAQ